MTVKKAFAEIIDLLEQNKEAPVKHILPKAIELASSSRRASSDLYHTNSRGEVVAIRCYYYKKWMDPRIAPFGRKASSPIGLSNTSSDGAAKAAAQLRQRKNEEAAILDRLVAGELQPDEINSERDRIAEEFAVIIPREDGYGFDTLEECLEYSKQKNLSVD